VLNLGKLVKEAVEKQGMLGWQYNTVGVSDGITMGGEGLYSLLIIIWSCTGNIY
jgi:dihydroxy-acid dehydratase